MILLGQPLQYQEYANSKFLPAICIGRLRDTSKYYDHILIYLKDGRVIEKEAALKELKAIRTRSKTSPTGWQIEYGPYCTMSRPIANGIKMKTPDNIKTYLEEINNLMLKEND